MGGGGFAAEYQTGFVAPDGQVKEKARQCRAFSQILK
jgi:hypothetical protein